MSALPKRWKSPTAASTVTADMASTPGMVIRRRTTESSNGLRRRRYRGLAETHAQYVLTAMACNVTRTADRIAETPRERTRSSRFHTLCTAAAGKPLKVTTESRR
ncbi:hypothetical protein [Streptomyces sp. NPDC059176]|uniref:hypothetical protein n=1 Tax=Streptomyces sp. NPDC059176 TaxID=3346758 RepID=UPI00368DF16F